VTVLYGDRCFHVFAAVLVWGWGGLIIMSVVWWVEEVPLSFGRIIGGRCSFTGEISSPF